MARFTLALFVACAIGTGFATAFDEASDRNDPLKDATREELRIKINQLELEVAHLKFAQKKLAAQQKVLPKWWNLTTTLGNQASPVTPQLPPGLLDLPEHQGLGRDGSHYPTMPNTNRTPLSDMPKGTSARQFNGMTVYNVPCTFRTVNGVPDYAGATGVAPPPSVAAYLDVIRQAESKRQLELQRFYQRKNSSIQRKRTEKPLPMNTSSAASLSP